MIWSAPTIVCDKKTPTLTLSPKSYESRFKRCSQQPASLAVHNPPHTSRVVTSPSSTPYLSKRARAAVKDVASSRPHFWLTIYCTPTTNVVSTSSRTQIKAARAKVRSGTNPQLRLRPPPGGRELCAVRDVHFHPLRSGPLCKHAHTCPSPALREQHILLPSLRTTQVPCTQPSLWCVSHQAFACRSTVVPKIRGTHPLPIVKEWEYPKWCYTYNERHYTATASRLSIRTQAAAAAAKKTAVSGFASAPLCLTNASYEIL